MQISAKTLTVGVLVVMAAGGCGSAASDSDAGEPPADAGRGSNEITGHHDHDHDHVLLQADDPLADASLSEIAEKSDELIEGTVTARRDEVRIVGVPDYLYSILTITPSSGSTEDARSVAAMTSTSDGIPIEVEGRASVPQVGETGVWFLDKMDSQFGLPNTYVITAAAGLIPVDIQGAPVDTGSDLPAAEESLTYDSGADLVADKVSDVPN